MKSIHGLRSYTFKKPPIKQEVVVKSKIGKWIFVDWRVEEKKNWWWYHYRWTHAECKNDCTSEIKYAEVLYEQWRPITINTFEYPSHNPLEPIGTDGSLADATFDLVEAIIEAKNRGSEDKSTVIRKEDGQKYCDQFN